MTSLTRTGLGALASIVVLALSACGSQRTFDSPEAAVTALSQAAADKDRSGIRHLFGPDAPELRSADEEQDRLDLAHFQRELAERTEVQPQGDDHAVVLIGDERWPFAVPLVREHGRWRFDTEAGIEELDNRRIGRNELRTMSALRTVVDAQNEYFSMDRDADGVREYADRIMSSPGARDGLYWPSPGGVDPSPLGSEIALASQRRDDQGERIPFNGYRFRLLTRQGPAAPGGAADYLSADGLTGGWSVLAWPDEYDHTGVMSFMVSSGGTIYQADLGPDTEHAVESIAEFNPAAPWTPALP